MLNSEMTRRRFVGAMAVAPLACGRQEWVELFDGRSLDGWRASENSGSWKVIDGQLAADGPRSHLFYDGSVEGGRFRNFELELEAAAGPLSNSGVYFHTAYQEEGWPLKGFEVQINNTATGGGNYRERKKTGSLYGVRNNYKQLVGDDEWFQLRVAVRGKNVEVRVNEHLLVDYTEPAPAILAEGSDFQRILDEGTFALQCHDPGSKARFRRIRVRPLSDDDAIPATGAATAFDQTILNMADRNIPLVDYHVHLKGGLTLEKALAMSRAAGIQYGIAANCGKGFPIGDDAGVRRFAAEMEGQPVFAAMQAEGREWTQMFSQEAAALFDYVFTDSMTWTDNRGRRMRLWMPDEVGQITDAQEFMDLLVEKTVGILDEEPIDIYVNPTFLPKVIAANYETLWTEARMKKVVAAAARNQIAIEINNRYRLPSAAFLRMAKEEGCKFSFGTNNGGADDVGRCEHAVRMTEELELGWEDFFVPGAWGPKAVERKGDALRG